MLPPVGATSLIRTVTAEHTPAEQSTARLRPPRDIASILSRVPHFGKSFGAAARPLLLLLLLSQSSAEDGRHVRQREESTGLDASFSQLGSTPTCSVVYATADIRVRSSPVAEGPPRSKTSSRLSVKKAVVHGESSPLPNTVAKLAKGPGASAAGSQSLVEKTSLNKAPAPAAAQDAVRDAAARRLAQSEDLGASQGFLQVRGNEAGDVAAVQSRAGSRRGDVSVDARRREQAFEERDTKAEARTMGCGGSGGKGGSRGNEDKKRETWDLSFGSLSNYSRVASAEDPSARHTRFSKLPPPLPERRVLPALRSFEKVHGQLTLFFNGFSRRGSVVAYDLLNELRTVSEAKMMMDVEFLVLDRVMEYYGATTHLRVVDTTVMHRLLDLKNLLPWKFPRLVSDIRKLALEYKPVLDQFLHRYEPIIEALVLVKVPAGVKPLRAFLAHVFGVPKEKLILASDMRDLRDLIPLKSIPEEFGNASGGKVRHGAENYMSWIIMLEEIAQKLGKNALSSHGKAMLKEFKENHRKHKAAADRKRDDANRMGFNARERGSSRPFPSPVLQIQAMGAEDSEGVTEEGGSEEDSENVDLYKKNKLFLKRVTQQSAADPGAEDVDEKDDLAEPSDEDFDSIS